MARGSARTTAVTRGTSFIGGEWRTSDELVPDLNPSDVTDVIGDFGWAPRSHAEEALTAARDALPGWSRSNIVDRSALLRRIGDELTARATMLATLLAREEGKTLRDASGEVARAAQIFHFYSGECLRPFGRSMPSLRDGITVSVDHEPVGVVAAITPWNFPLAVPAWKIAPALAYGNTVVFKPSEVTPGCGVALIEVISACGVPDGVVNLVTGSGAALGEALVHGADAVTFTGSTATGRTILSHAAAGMTKVQLELGGKSPLVVLDDADIDLAVDAALDGAFAQTGQRCTASSRLVVMARVHDEFSEKLATKVRALRVGHALDAETDIGPVATENQLEKNLSYVDGAIQEGAELLCGGTRVERDSVGYYLAPTLFGGTTNDMRLNREEVFGPVVGIIRVDDLDEAIAVARDSEYALSSGICTTNLSAAERFRREARAGMVVVNGPTSGADYHVPFGGRTPSGYGPREQGSTAAEFFTEIKTTYVNHGVGA